MSSKDKKDRVIPEFSTELEWLIYFLWFQPRRFKFKIAETVVMNEAGIQNWFFSAAQGHILKKNRCNLKVSGFCKSFLKGLNTNFEQVSATAYHYEFRKDSENYHLKND